MAVKNYGTSGGQVDTVAEVHALSWADLKDTIAAWSKDWEEGYAKFATTSGTAAAAAYNRARAYLLVYMVWVARHQNGTDRINEVDVNPQLVASSFEIDRLLTRLSPHDPLHPANS